MFTKSKKESKSKKLAELAGFIHTKVYRLAWFCIASMASVAILATCASSGSSGSSGSGGSGGTTTPAAPTITVTAMPQSATVSASASVNLTWTEPANTDFLGVSITYTVAGGTASTPVRVAKGTTTRTFTGLTGGAVYTFTVSAVNGSGTLAAGTVSTTTVATATATSPFPLPTIASGSSHSCAVDNGRAYCWGSGGSGRLGNGATTSSLTPVAVLSGVQSDVANTFLTGVTASATGDAHSCAIANEQVYCWGTGGNGQLGNGQLGNGQLGNGATGNQSSPVAVLSGAQSTMTGSLLTGVTAIIAGGAYTCAIANEQVYCWGLQTNGRLGNGVSTAANISSPVAVLSGAQSTMTGSLLTGVTAISTGQFHSCAIANRVAYCWGDQATGRLGNGEDGAANISSPVAVLSGAQSAAANTFLTGVTAIATGISHSCAIASGQAYCWGAGGNGRLGNGATGSQSSPVAVLSGVQSAATGSLLTGVTAITAGNSHSCAIASGQAYCWGTGGSGRLGNGATGNQSSPVAVLSGAQSTMTGSLLTGVTAITAGFDFNCTIASGVAYCWGAGSLGELGNGATTGATSPVAVGDFPR